MATRGRPRAVADDEVDDDNAGGLTAREAIPIGRTAPVPIPIEEDDAELTPADRVRMLLAQSDEDRTRVKVYRRQPGKSAMEWCTDYTVSEFEAGDLEMIRNAWGAGTFEIRVINERGIAGKVLVTIAERQAGATAPVAAAPAVSPEIAATLRALAEGQQRIAEALAQRPDPAAEMQRMFALMAGMREAMGLNVAPAVAPAVPSTGAVLGELVSALKTLREISSDINPPAAPDMDNPMSLIGPIVEVVKLAKGQPTPAPASAPALPAPPAVSVPASFSAPVPAFPPHSSAAKPAPNPAPRAVPANPAQGPAAPLQRAQKPAPVVSAASPQSAVSLPVTKPAQPAQPATPQPNEGQPMMTNEEAAELRGVLDNLCQMAASGISHEEGAEKLYEVIPDELVPHLQTPVWFAVVAQFHPPVTAHEKWFRDCAARLVEIFEEEANGDDSEEADGEPMIDPEDMTGQSALAAAFDDPDVIVPEPRM